MSPCRTPAAMIIPKSNGRGCCRQKETTLTKSFVSTSCSFFHFRALTMMNQRRQSLTATAAACAAVLLLLSQSPKAAVVAFSTTSTPTSRRGASALPIASPIQPSLSSSSSATRLHSTVGNNNNNVIEQLSPDCVQAVLWANQVGQELGETELSNELLLLGVVEHSENAANFIKTNTEMNVFLGNPAVVRQAVEDVLSKKRGKNNNNNNDDATAASSPLPLGDDVKRLLTRANAIADYLNDRVSVKSEHVLLAILGYNFGRNQRIVLRETPAAKVLMQLDFPATPLSEMCNLLVADLAAVQRGESGSINGNTAPQSSKVVVGGESQGVISGTLSQVGVDLTEQAMQGLLDPVYGRNEEILSCLQTLGRRRKNNPCLVGEAGVGKTAIVEGIAQILGQALAEDQEKNAVKIQINLPNPFAKKEVDPEQDDDVEVDLPELPPCPNDLRGYRLVSVDLASLVAGTANRGDFEKRVQNLIQEASSSKVILFFDEVHNIVGAGDPNGGAMSAANLLKPALARGEIRVLGATTTPEYRRYIERDTALERRFQPCKVQEPSVEETVKILASVINKYEDFHKVEYTNNSLRMAAKLSDRYISDRFLPDKAIDLVDEAGSMIKQSFFDATGAAPKMDDMLVTEDDIALCVSKFTGIPVGQLDTGEKERLRNLEMELQKRIKGQSVAVSAVAKAIRRARAGMRDGRRPVASFLFAGPTGVGKTEICKALASTYFGQEKDMIRIDGSEYMDRFSSSRLVGAPPGYVGYDEGGQLTEAVRRSPHSVILFDEMEKAHEDVMNVFLQVMDDGILTDGKGRRVNFKNTVLVLTTNVGSEAIIELSRSGATAEEIAGGVQGELEKKTKPEFLNRLDDIVVFNPLEYDTLKEITGNLIADTKQRVYAESQIILDVTDSVQEAITREAAAVASLYGARPIRRAVQRYVEDSMAEAVISEFVNDGDSVKLSLKSSGNDGTPAEVGIAVEGKGSMGVVVDNNPALEEAMLDYEARFGDLPDVDEDEDDELPPEPSAFQ